jgi:hypothetical protein
MPGPRVISPRRYSEVYGNRKSSEPQIEQEQTYAPQIPKHSFWRNVRSQHIGFMLFIMIIFSLYIWNSHTAEKQIRLREKSMAEIRELRNIYHIADAHLSLLRKQTHISSRVDTLGLKKLTRPPYRLALTSHE